MMIETILIVSKKDLNTALAKCEQQKKNVSKGLHTPDARKLGKRIERCYIGEFD